LSRSPRPAPWRVVSWDGATPGGWISEFEQSDVCINLAGRSVNCRYTPANRSIIYESRIQSTRLLNQVLSSLNRAPRLWVNASTATIYRHALDRAMNEAEGELGGNEPGAPDTWNFSIDVAKGWEEAFFSTPTPLTRKIAMRSALTLSPDRGGVFDVLLGRCDPGRTYFIGQPASQGAQGQRQRQGHQSTQQPFPSRRQQ
jgi:NAD dependent epimerase/dehydratase family enzyme